MSIHYEKEIFNDGETKLLINFSGIDADDSTYKDQLKLNLYAFSIKDFRLLFSTRLNFNQIQDLYDHLDNISLIRDKESSDKIRFIEANQEITELLNYFKIIDAVLVKLILDKADQEEKLNLIIEALSESEIQNLHASIRQSNHKKAIKVFTELLHFEESNTLVEEVKKREYLTEYQANQPEKIFQNWIEKNLWTLGIDYIKKHTSRQIGINSESDLIMETTDGYIDLIELKRPKFELFSYDESHKSHYPSKELSKVIGQCLQYLKVLDEYKNILEKEYKLKVLRPRIKIIVGRSINFTDSQYDALRMLNSNLNHIEIITFDYLKQCGDNIISYYDNQISTKINITEKTFPTIS